MVTKPLTDETREDAKAVILARFPPSALSVFEKTMSNPLRAECHEIGDIVYDQGRPVGFRAANRRRMHWGAQAMLGRVRGLTCRLKSSPRNVMEVLCAAQIQAPRGCAIAFSNSQSAPTEKRAIQMGATLGPESCTRFLCRVVRPLRFCAYFFMKKILRIDATKKVVAESSPSEWSLKLKSCTIRRMPTVDTAFFEELMKRYLCSNRGLICDRDSATVKWLFEESVQKGVIALLEAKVNDEPAGYVALKTDESGSHWLLLDWFAVGNDRTVLEELLVGACRFLKEETSAMVFKTIGYPQYVQPLLRRFFPFAKKTGVNWFSYNWLSADLARQCEHLPESEASWFFGPFDGDFCM